MFETRKELKRRLTCQDIGIAGLEKDIKKLQQKRDDEVRELKNQIAVMKDSAERDEINLLLDIKIKQAKMEIAFEKEQLEVKEAWQAMEVELVREHAAEKEAMRIGFAVEKEALLKTLLQKLPDFDIKFDCKAPDININTKKED